MYRYLTSPFFIPYNFEFPIFNSIRKAKHLFQFDRRDGLIAR